jgi:nitroreductase
MTTANSRTADHEIDPLFLQRWSPRAFDGSALTQEETMTLFEAARWAPSSYNSQPWRFIYARRGTLVWPRLLDLLVPGNKSWAERAGLLIIVASNALMTPPGKDQPVPSYTHSFDTGAAWACLALQATRMGLQAHGMVGFDKERAAGELRLPPGYRVEAAIAVGRPGDKSVLTESQQAREHPSGRIPVTSFVFEGSFPA